MERGASFRVSRSAQQAACCRYLTILFLPIVLGMHHLYQWTNEDVVNADAILKGKAAYLNTSFFLVRAAFYFVVWNGLSFLLNKWQKEQDETANPELPLRMQRLEQRRSADSRALRDVRVVQLDHVADPHWFSTIYGALVIVRQGLVTLAFQIIALTWLARRKPMSTALDADRTCTIWRT
ncbi:MAG: hypothetical protein QM736_03120 [Vicinamibacterales bacterium]